MRIEIWSDFACPYCYIGKKRLEKALEELKKEEETKIVFKSFQLDPSGVRMELSDYSEYMAKKYNIPYDQAKAQVDGMVNSAKELGLDFRYDILIKNNMVLAHQIAKYAKTVGKDKVIVERFFKGYFEEGADLGDIQVLSTMSKEVGLDPQNFKKIIEQKLYLSEVLADQKQASDMGVRGVPFIVIDGKVSVSGAQSIEYFKLALEKASEV
ncbi:MAG TPA: disulfide bond formation protein DsbA [Fusobacteriaceae bacterium]|nr:disulfide bond formation protein DsbA [Fusobacteriaceae bacterium]